MGENYLDKQKIGSELTDTLYSIYKNRCVSRGLKVQTVIIWKHINCYVRIRV